MCPSVLTPLLHLTLVAGAVNDKDLAVSFDQGVSVRTPYPQGLSLSLYYCKTILGWAWLFDQIGI